MNSFDGLPAHPLLVHLAAVVIPAAAVLAVVAVLWPRARRWMAWMRAVVALIAVIVTPLTTSARRSVAPSQLRPTTTLFAVHIWAGR
ncbi:hypothetical protein [Gordonia polyisoprenivorans]|uniref:hypothetical protein n=1 Tax=Gordonia polyisoprenivorans TaxID=84595 RepID=UPI000688F5F5|nr:hypothetical protein [Gordonia polyisoprenivorans]